MIRKKGTRAEREAAARAALSRSELMGGCDGGNSHFTPPHSVSPNACSEVSEWRLFRFFSALLNQLRSLCCREKAVVGAILPMRTPRRHSPMVSSLPRPREALLLLGTESTLTTETSSSPWRECSKVSVYFTFLKSFVINFFKR